MGKPVQIVIWVLALILFGVAGFFYMESQRIQRQTDDLRMLTTSQPETAPAQTVAEAEPEYDPTDLHQTPPGIKPFWGSSVCLTHWGNHLRQYCDGGDAAVLETIEGGDDQQETKRILNMCLNDLVQMMDAYGTDFRPMDSELAQNETNRKAVACKITGAYGDKAIFNDSSVFYMVKEHMESGNISRMEN